MSNISISDLSSNSDLDLTDLSGNELDLKGGWLWVFAIACALLLEHD
jgi:hypothetical protein